MGFIEAARYHLKLEVSPVFVVHTKVLPEKCVSAFPDHLHNSLISKFKEVQDGF